MSTQWTHEHCERCEDEGLPPRLITHEIWCAKHYEEWLNEPAEDY